MNLENYFISKINNRHIGDDGALIDGIVYSKDAFFENIHFKTSWMNHYQIAQKAILVNISDAIAMNAKAKYILLSVAMPKSITKNEMRDLVEGFSDTASKFGAEIIGGDTISNTKLDITVTVISQTQNPLRRKGLKNGDFLAYTGELGKSAKDLKKLLNKGRINKNSKFVNIQLREKFINRSARYLSAGMDISDGLYSDLEKLSLVNRVSYKFHKKIAKRIGCSGEEYEMLISFDKRMKKTLQRRAAQTRTPLNIFATATRAKYTNRCKAHHF